MGNQHEESEDTTITNVSKLCEHISFLYLNPKFSDIILTVDGEKLHVHKVILAARSEYFEALLYDDSQKSIQAEITISDVSLIAFKMLLKYIYTGSVTIVPSDMNLTLEVLGLAHQYSFNDLELSIIKTIKSVLQVQNVCSILNTGNLYDLYELKDVCHTFLDKHASEIVTNNCFNELTQSSMIKLLERDSFFAPEIEIFKGVAKWCKVNDDVDNLVIKCIRLPWCSVIEIVSIVWPTRLVENEVLLNAIAEFVNVKPRKSYCRARLAIDKNIATPQQKSEVLFGTSTTFLLSGNRDVSKFAYHSMDDKNGITIKLGVPSFINHIHMMLWDSDLRYYSYYIEVSIDQRKWKKIIDYSQYACRSYQNLYFQQEIVQYIRVVGTQNTVDKYLHLVFFEADYKSNVPKIVNGIICPIVNVATLDKKAVVVSGTVPEALLNGDTKNYDGGKGFTYHLIGPNNSIIIQLAQPYLLSSMKLLLWDGDDRTYKYYIESSVNKSDWEMVVDRRNENCKSWQLLRFTERPMVFIKIVGTYNSANVGFHCVHFECPASNAELR